MKRSASWFLMAIISVWIAASVQSQAQQQGISVSIDFPKKVEAYLRELFALGPSVAIRISNPTASQLAGLVQFNVEVTSGGQTSSVPFFATPDARYIVRGEIFDASTNPFSANRSRIDLKNQPAKGPTDASVTIVEYADFQCPSCRQLHEVLKQILPRYPQVRLVFKDLPLTQIHPWAMTAALGGRCAFQQNPDAFWKVHEQFFANQQTITPSNVWNTAIEYARQAGLDEAAFKLCMTGKEATAAVEASVNEARALNVANTPTTFVNGRRVVGPDAESLEQYIRYELSKRQASAGTVPPRQ